MKNTLITAVFLSLVTGLSAAYNTECYRNDHGSHSQRGGYDQQGRGARFNSEYNNYSRRNDQYQFGRDRDILVAVRQRLSQEGFYQGGNDLELSVESGKVVVRGQVASQKERDDLEQTIRNVGNVDRVVLDVSVAERDLQGKRNGASRNNGQNGNHQNNNDSNLNNSNDNDQGYNQRNRGHHIAAYERNGMEQNGQLQNGSLEKRVKDTLSGGWFSKDYENVEARVHDGTVTLKGFVNSADEKQNIENKVREIQGVRNIENKLKIKGEDVSDSSLNNSQRSHNRSSGY